MEAVPLKTIAIRELVERCVEKRYGKDAVAEFEFTQETDDKGNPLYDENGEPVGLKVKRAGVVINKVLENRIQRAHGRRRARAWR